ncbi:hypothetical protein SEPCBS119000_005712 [Sporothrix epigloea]|uniref:Nudix hydrolase domain-containing protein n=1 Tax=Sporothrix epigloea TaxID=1892477 RepID=A0ABP0DZB2_9PEZI
MPSTSRKPAPSKKMPAIAKPSSSVVVISPENEILLLHRCKTGSFSSAHVFPGGNLSTFHEGSSIPAVDSHERHMDGPAYRIAAIRETFEESGVLLARPAGSTVSPSAASAFEDRMLFHVSDEIGGPARVAVADNKIRFEDWLSSVGGVPDNENLIPFTRWLTPPHFLRRYTTQMYLYFLPLNAGAETAKAGDVTVTNNGASADQTEVIEAEFATADAWVQRARDGDIILFPPQLYILSLLAPLLKGQAGNYVAERMAVADLVNGGPAPGEDPATFVPWADRVISPRMAGKLPDDKKGRTVMTLEHPGTELKSTGRAGDFHRVIAVGNVPPGPPRDVELFLRADVMPRVQAKPRIQATGVTEKL